MISKYEALNLFIFDLEMNQELILYALLFIVVIILIVCLIASKRASILHRYRYKMSSNLMPMHRYLNVNSTLAPRTGYYNPSDLGYRNMRILRNEKEAVFNEIKRFVNAPANARVVLVSGATEAIATCVNWAKHYNRYGDIYGTSFDHSSIKANAENQELKYKLLDDNITNPSAPNDERRRLSVLFENPSAIFLTHVNSRTGEILPDEYLNIAKRIKTKLNPEFEDENEVIVLPYKPLVFIDATQSITKIPIDMSATKANALFFSMHKIGGPMNLGVLIVNEEDKPFIPLIAGAQNNGMRGGTMNETEFVENRDVFKYEPAPDTREESWNKAVKKLEENGVHVEKPKGPHLYNTIVVEVKSSCPLGVIDKLYAKGICVGTMSACASENDVKNMEGGAISHIRISFMNADDIDDNVVNVIADEINNEI